MIPTRGRQSLERNGDRIQRTHSPPVPKAKHSLPEARDDGQKDLEPIPEDEIEIERIRLPEHLLRRAVDPVALDRLAQSIQSDGLLHPIVVLPLPDGDVLLSVGYRRYLACVGLGWSRIPAARRPDLVPGATTTMRITLAENDCRADPCAYDYACYVVYLRELRLGAGEEGRIQDIAEDLRAVRAPYDSDGWISQMLQIGTNITTDFLDLAGVDVADLSGISRTALHRVARISDSAERAAALRAAATSKDVIQEDASPPLPTATRRPPYKCDVHQNGAETLRIDPRRMTLADCDQLETKAREVRARVEQRLSA